MKRIEALLREYSRSLSDDDLRYLNMLLQQNLQGDKAKALKFLATNKKVDRWLTTAASAEDFFDMVDVVGEFIKRENNRRYALLKEERERKKSEEKGDKRPPRKKYSEGERDLIVTT